jgi:hypothetical protein
MAAPLPDGRVLIAGGYSNGVGYLQSAELFDPGSDAFTTLPASGSTELQAARSEAATVPLKDGRVLIAGGASGGSLQSAELFNPAGDTFTALPASGNTELQTGRFRAIAATLANGQVLIAGGFNGSYLQSAELFDPATDTFNPLPASGTTQLQVPRDGAISALLPTGQVLVAGGNDFGEPLQSAELYLSAAQATSDGGSFGSQPVGTPTPASVLVVTNIGAQGLAITGTSLAGADPGDFAITADGCSGRKLAFQQSCTITSRFMPTAAGARHATIALSDNEPSPAAIPLSGTGIAIPNTTLGPLAGLVVAPFLSGLRESAKTWREGNALAHISAKKSPKKLPVGTTFTFNLNERASVTFAFTQPAAGRKIGKKCVPQTKKNRTRPRCTRTVTAGTLTFAGHAGTNKVRFAGRISAHKRLSPGGYTLHVTAAASGVRSLASTLHFTIASR